MLRNRFLMCGILSEIIIDMFSTHMKIKMSINVGAFCYNVAQIISKKCDKSGYDAWLSMIPVLRPLVDGYVTKNGIERIYTINSSKEQSGLIVSGNISENDGIVYFNAQYCALSKNIDQKLDIQLDGQWIGKSRLVNICGEYPREFFIQQMENCEKRIYRLSLGYNAGFDIKDGKIIAENCGLYIKSAEPLDFYMDDEQIEKISLELDIIQKNS